VAKKSATDLDVPMPRWGFNSSARVIGENVVFLKLVALSCLQQTDVFSGEKTVAKLKAPAWIMALVAKTRFLRPEPICHSRQ